VLALGSAATFSAHGIEDGIEFFYGWQRLQWMQVQLTCVTPLHGGLRKPGLL
jgi:hypothetical protein